MNTSMLRRVRRLFPYGSVDRRVTRHNRRAWVRSVRHLGGGWVLAEPAKPLAGSFKLEGN